MTIKTTTEFAPSAKLAGYRFVGSADIAVVSTAGKRTSGDVPLRAVVEACVDRFGASLSEWLHILPQHQTALFIATPFWNHNALQRRRGVWASDGLEWVPATAVRSPSIEVSSDHATRFAGTVQIDDESLLDAAEFVRTNSGAFILISSRNVSAVEFIRETLSTGFRGTASAVDWNSLLEMRRSDDIFVRVTGAFDDAEASIDAFLSADLLRKLERVA